MTENQINVINIISKYQHLKHLELYFKAGLVVDWINTLSDADMAILDAYFDYFGVLDQQLKTSLIV